MQIVHFHQSNASGAVYTAHNGRVVARWQICNNRRFPSVSRRVTAVLDFLHLVMGDNSADDSSLPVIVSANQSASAIVQFQCWILQWIGNAKLTELRANGADNHSLWFGPLNNEPSNHHVVARLHKGTRGDVTKPRRRCWRCCRRRSGRWSYGWRRCRCTSSCRSCCCCRSSGSSCCCRSRGGRRSISCGCRTNCRSWTRSRRSVYYVQYRWRVVLWRIEL